MKNEPHTIAPLVNGVRHLSDIEVFQCFNVEIDEPGQDLWGYRVKQDRTIGKRSGLKQDSWPQEPGMYERSEGLRYYYENQNDEVEPV